MLRLLFGVLALALIGAYLTNPGPQAVHEKAQVLLRDAIEEGALDDLRDPTLAVLVLGCKADANACSDLLMQGIRLSHNDMILFSRVGVEGFGRRATCYGAFQRLVCPGGLIP